MANNEPIYNAVICGAGGSTQERWITSTDSGDYDPSIIELIAAAVDADIPTDTIGASQQALMQSICQGVFAGRFPTADNYTAIAAAIVAAYTALAASLFPDVTPGGTFDPIFQQRWVDTTSGADGNGSIGTPYNTFAAAMSALLESTEAFDPWTIFLAQNIDATGFPIPDMGAGVHDNAKVKFQGVLNLSPFETEGTFLSNLAVDGQGNNRITLDFENIDIEGLTIANGALALWGTNSRIIGVASGGGTITGYSNLVNCSVAGIILDSWDLRMQGGYIESYFQDSQINNGVLDSVEFITGAHLRWTTLLNLRNCKFQAGVQLLTQGGTLTVDVDTWGAMQAAGVTFPDNTPQLTIVPWLPVLANKAVVQNDQINPNSVSTFDAGVLVPAAERSTGCIANFAIAVNTNLSVVGAFIDANNHLNVLVKNSAGTSQSLVNPTYTVTYFPRITP